MFKFQDSLPLVGYLLFKERILRKNEIPLTNEQKKTAEENIGLVYKVVGFRMRRYGGTRYAKYPGIKEDMISHGMLGLISAAKGFDKNYGTTFSTYAWRSISNTITRGLERSGFYVGSKKKKRIKIMTSTDVSASNDFGPGGILDAVETKNSDYQRMDADKLLGMVKSSLKEEEYECLHRIFCRKDSMRDVARDEKVTHQAIQQRVKAAIRKIRRNSLVATMIADYTGYELK